MSYDGKEGNISTFDHVQIAHAHYRCDVPLNRWTGFDNDTPALTDVSRIADEDLADAYHAVANQD